MTNSDEADIGDGPRPDVTEDVFLDGRLRLLQPRDSYRAGLDAVLLAAAVPVADHGPVLDCGAGVGTVGLCVAARVAAARVTLVEIDAGLAQLARTNIERNRLADRCRVVNADITAPAASLAALDLPSNGFAHIVCNPPYLAAGQHQTPTHPVTARAFEMPEGGLDRWARFWARMATAGGTLTLIHRAGALKSVLDVLDGRFGDIAVTPLHPWPDEPARRIVVAARKGSRGPLRLLPGIVLHDKPDRFTPAIEAVVRLGAALPSGEAGT